VLYATTSHEVMLTALHAGARALLAEDASRAELVLAVRAVARGDAMLGGSVARRLVELFRECRGPVVRERLPLAADLTAREHEILLLTAEGLSTQDIARRLLIGAATVRTHVYRLRCKLQVKDRAQLVSLAYRTGLVETA
jgi:DNA-binding NarL/FixJ family response regulator